MGLNLRMNKKEKAIEIAAFDSCYLTLLPLQVGPLLLGTFSTVMDGTFFFHAFCTMMDSTLLFHAFSTILVSTLLFHAFSTVMVHFFSTIMDSTFKLQVKSVLLSLRCFSQEKLLMRKQLMETPKGRKCGMFPELRCPFILCFLERPSMQGDHAPLLN